MKSLVEALISKDNIKNASIHSNELYIILTRSLRALGEACRKIKSSVYVQNKSGKIYLIVPKDDIAETKKIITDITDSYIEYKSKVSNIDELKDLIKNSISCELSNFCE